MTGFAYYGGRYLTRIVESAMLSRAGQMKLITWNLNGRYNCAR